MSGAAVGLAAWLAGCAWPSGTGEPGRSAPAIAFARTAHDFGRVEQGATLHHVFHFTNEGGADLAVENLRTGCGSRAVVTPAEPLAPGKAGAIRADFDTGSRSGRQRDTITVYTNDPRQPVTVLTLAAEIIGGVVADPPQLYVGHVRRGERVRRAVAVRTGSPRVKLEEIRSEGPPVTVEVRDLDSNRPGKQFTVVLAPDAPLGFFQQAVRVVTDGERPAVLRIPVVGVVVEDVTVAPAHVTFDTVQAGTAPPVRHVLVENAGQAAVRITAVDWEPRLGRAEVEAVRDGFRYRVRLTLDEPVAADQGASVLRLATDHPRQPTVEVPVSHQTTSSGAGS